MRQIKTHWAGERKSKGAWREVYSLCGRINPSRFANAKRKVTCANCRRILQLPPLP